MKKILTLFLAPAVVSAGIGFTAGEFLIAEPAKASIEKEAPAHGAEEAKSDGHGETAKKPKAEVVNIGRIMVPIQKPQSITYVVARIGLSVSGTSAINYFKTDEGATVARSEILTSLIELSETSLMRGAKLDTAKISELVLTSVSEELDGIDDILFINLVKNDVARS